MCDDDDDDDELYMYKKSFLLSFFLSLKNYYCSKQNLTVAFQDIYKLVCMDLFNLYMKRVKGNIIFLIS
jgi:hypothetical protein